MPEYRRAFVPGGTFFITLVTHNRRPLFQDTDNVAHLRQSIRFVKVDMPFDLPAAVVLPDHLHMLMALPDGDADFSKRIGRIKARFTKSLSGHAQSMEQEVGGAHPTPSRAKHREAGVWQRRFWEHTIRDDRDFQAHLDYIHFNPVKHGVSACPHSWPHSSFRRWVESGAYEPTWCCSCDDRRPQPPNFKTIEDNTGE